jgi:hypothetical protein
MGWREAEIGLTMIEGKMGTGGMAQSINADGAVEGVKGLNVPGRGAAFSCQFGADHTRISEAQAGRGGKAPPLKDLRGRVAVQGPRC